MQPAPETGEARHRLLATLLVAFVSSIPVFGLFTTHRIFFVRDLSLFFWSRHLWLRHTLLGGQAPWWDPYVASGQSAIADALNQLLMPLTVAVRLLPSDVVSFNLWVALPIPIAAAGMFLFLRRALPCGAAALGACVFGLCGPVVSMVNTPNLAWSVALLPWVIWSVPGLEVRGSKFVRGSFEESAATTGERASILDSRSSLCLAVTFALQGLSGEPVTWAATGVLAFAYAVVQPDADRGASTFRRKISRTIPAVIGLIAGAGLAAMQLAPTALAAVRAQRGALAAPDFWSLHPLSLWEVLAPHLFGNYHDSFLADLPWMGALNFGRDPFFYSLYLGPLVLLLAAVGATAGRRALFWIAVVLVAIVAALGGYSPLYPLARRAVPALMYFRFPVKYIVFAMFAGAVLAARGWAAIATRDRDTWPVLRGAAIVGGLALLASVVMLVRHDLSLRLAHWLAVSTHLKDPGAGADFLARAAPPLALRGAALLLAGCLLIAASARRAQILRVLFAAVCADLLVANGGLNPTLEVARLSPPDWYTAAAGEPRVYVAGRVRGFMNTADPDAPPSSDIPMEFTAVERRMELDAELPMAPSGWRVREALSYDLPNLWPAAYEATVKQFERADTDARRAFLRRAGVRTCVVRESQAGGAPVVGEAPDWRMRAVECNPGAARVFIAGSAQVAPDAADLDWQRAVLFDPAAADDLVRLDRLPPAAGTASSPQPPSVHIAEDGTTRVVVEATLDRSGIVVLRDSYDDSWAAQVDGVPAALARANGLYRAVSLPPGRHVIRFAYRPRDLVTGLIISGATALILLAGRVTRLRRPSRQRGFTLIELMIVLAIIAILLAIAFNEYRGMQARGNETSALASLRSIAAAQWQFALTCGNLHYATKLPDLATPVPTTGQGFLSPDMTSAEKLEKSGYIFEMTAKPLDDVKPACNGVPVSAGYAVTADPAKPGVSGTVFYGVNADRILYIDEEKTFTGSLPETGAPNHGAEVKK